MLSKSSSSLDIEKMEFKTSGLFRVSKKIDLSLIGTSGNKSSSASMSKFARN
jgi:hypothetical protein